ncbi:MAG: ribosome-binding factor A [Chlamydiia bacterium]|nr:ribosome-binding factor A [Chlamydiia bacterium]
MIKERRLEKIKELLRREISAFLKLSIRNPHIVDNHFIITRLTLTKDLTYAFIYIKPVQEDKESVLLKHLNHASSKIGFSIAPNIKLRRFPRIHFKIDKQYGEYKEGVLDPESIY